MNGQQLRGITRLAVCVAACAVLVGCATTTGGGAPNPLVGTWNVVMESALGTTPIVLTVNADLSGMVSAEGLGDVPISETVVDGQSVTFKIVFDLDGQELPATFEGTIDGDSISGEFITDLGNGTVTGTRG